MTLSEKSIKIEILPFDSSLFGYPVGKCIADEFWEERRFLEQTSDFDLVYVFSKKPLKLSLDRFTLADIKLTFEKALQLSEQKDPLIQAYKKPLSPQLFALALESGIYSRFYTDQKFQNGEFEKLYRIWIQNALDREEVLITDDLSGFVSCEVSKNSAQIGLIAVNENHRGKGWAKRLMQAAEQTAFDKGAKSIAVSTQEINIPASTLYQSLGYNLKERTFIYHYWKC